MFEVVFLEESISLYNEKSKCDLGWGKDKLFILVSAQT